MQFESPKQQIVPFNSIAGLPLAKQEEGGVGDKRPLSKYSEYPATTRPPNSAIPFATFAQFTLDLEEILVGWEWDGIAFLF